ncbi:hypothetical protein OCF84_20675 (plasmid) [Shewanella xiamenensis]|uniref:hypothetical protein n=1 Tax=Shewanella xiamenensis TaxID=332186 RepID=UPI0024ADF1FE|nr:hypothetical protein [Shewanella xiamenensis]WHF57933.1 hypothetical protein OCF84_20675 [Shewanella xiamenensis]
MTWLINKRRKVSLEQQYDSTLNYIVEPYNPEQGISFLESLSIQVDMYSEGSDLMRKISEYAGLTPLMITLCEMEALENKLSHEIMVAQIELSRIDAYELLIMQGTDSNG